MYARARWLDSSTGLTAENGDSVPVLPLITTEGYPRGRGGPGRIARYAWLASGGDDRIARLVDQAQADPGLRNNAERTSHHNNGIAAGGSSRQGIADTGGSRERGLLAAQDVREVGCGDRARVLRRSDGDVAGDGGDVVENLAWITTREHADDQVDRAAGETIA